MLEVVVGAAAVILLVVGVAVMFGPALPRQADSLRLLIRRLRDRPPPPAPFDRRELVLPGIHPTTQRAVHAATRISSLLRTHGQERMAAELRNAVRRLSLQEAEGLKALRRLEPELQQMRVEDESAHLRYRQLLKELRQHVNDRAEQLELLPFR